MGSYFKLYKDRAGEYRWSLYAPNHKIIATSGEGYTSKQSAEEGVAAVKKYAPNASTNDET